ncbi:MAG: protein kinase [Vicinamibacterales bacterium]
MALVPGTLVGPYEIVGRLGAGGMGEVFKARDSRLHRDVALKVIVAARALDAGSVARFEREARAAAALNHPHIVGIHDVGTFEGAPFLISELLEGDSLRHHIDRGRVAMRDALLWTAQAADALAAAHAKGIVHRDVKPENLFVTADGRLKVLDFGIAKLLDGAANDAATSAGDTPTLSGTVLGTAGYMSPEQAAGRTIDHRSDLFSLGAVLYELLTGQRAFRGATAVETMAAIVKDDVVAPSALNPAVAGHLERIVLRCLDKLPDRRFQSARDLAFALTSAASESGGHPRAHDGSPPAPSPWSRGKVLTATLAAMAAGAAAALLLRPAPVVSSRSPKHFVIETRPVPLSEALVPIALSPDGSTLAYTGGSHEGAQLYVRPLGSLTPRVLSGTLQAADPFFSPDGRWIAFRAAGQLRKVPAGGGPVVTIASIGSLGSLGGAWARDGWIYYSYGTRVWRVRDDGGTPAAVTTPDPTRGEQLHYWPQVLPGGTSLLLTVVTGPVEASRLALVDLAGGATRTLVDGGAFGRYLASGHLFYVKGSTGFVVPFDPSRAVSTGEPRAVIEHIEVTGGAGARFAAADDGTVAFVQRTAAVRRAVVATDRAGHAMPIDVPPGEIEGLSISPDERWLAIVRRDGTARQLWIRDQQQGSTSQLTFEGAVSGGPAVWRPDSRAVTYARRVGNQVEMVTQAIEGTRVAEVLWSGPDPVWPGSWSADGQQLFYMLGAPTTPGDLAVFDVGTATSRPVLSTAATEWGARISPDGQWLAYVSNGTGVWEAYVRPWPNDGTPRRVSANGGTEVVWRKDGRELFFRSEAGLMAAAVTPGAGFSIGEPRVVLQLVAVPGSPGLPNYDVSRDGQQIVMVQRGADEDAWPPIHVIVDWLTPQSP